MVGSHPFLVRKISCKTLGLIWASLLVCTQVCLMGADASRVDELYSLPGLHSFHSKDSNGRYKRSFTGRSGDDEEIRVDYDVQLREQVVHLHDIDLNDIQCEKTYVFVHNAVFNRMQHSLKSGAIVVSSKHRCSHLHNSGRAPLLHRLSAPRVRDERFPDHFAFNADAVDPFSLFTNGTITFSSSRLPVLRSGDGLGNVEWQNYDQSNVRTPKRTVKRSECKRDEDETDESNKRKLSILNALGSLGRSFVKRIEATAKDFISSAQALGKFIVTTAWAAGEYLTKGSVDYLCYGVLFSAEWNYNSSNSGSAVQLAFYPDPAVEVGCDRCLSCRNCTFTMDVGIYFHIDVTDYDTIRELSLLLRGDVDANFDISIGNGAQIYEEIRLYMDTLVPEYEIAFSVAGIPIFVGFAMEVELGVRGEIITTGNVSMSAKAKGCGEFGIEMNPRSGEVEPTDRIFFSFDGSIPAQMGLTTVTGSISPFFRTRSFLRIERFGGPYVIIEPSAELAIAVGSQSCQIASEATLPSVTASVNVGVNIGIGGFINFVIVAGAKPIFERVWDARVVVDMKETLAWICLHGQAVTPPALKRDQQEGAVEGYLTEGRTFHGFQLPCMRNEFSSDCGAVFGPRIYYLMSVTMTIVRYLPDKSFVVGVSYVGSFGDAANPLILSGNDRDNDSVIDFKWIGSGSSWSIGQNDMCSFTNMQNRSATEVTRDGCAPDELVDSKDRDRDGIADDEDKCPDTPRGWNAIVSRNITAGNNHFGCSACDLKTSECTSDEGDASYVKCWINAFYRASPVPGEPVNDKLALSGSYRFVRIKDPSLFEETPIETHGGNWRGCRFQYESCSQAMPGCACSANQCIFDGDACGNSPFTSTCDNETFFSPGFSACVCSGESAQCVRGNPGCACKDSTFEPCNDSKLRCSAGYCIYRVLTGAVAVAAGANFSKYELDSSYTKTCTKFPHAVDVVPIETFSGFFTETSFKTTVVDVSGENENMLSSNECQQWVLQSSSSLPAVSVTEIQLTAIANNESLAASISNFNFTADAFSGLKASIILGTNVCKYSSVLPSINFAQIASAFVAARNQLNRCAAVRTLSKPPNYMPISERTDFHGDKDSSTEIPCGYGRDVNASIKELGGLYHESAAASVSSVLRPSQGMIIFVLASLVTTNTRFILSAGFIWFLRKFISTLLVLQACELLTRRGGITASPTPQPTVSPFADQYMINTVTLPLASSEIYAQHIISADTVGILARANKHAINTALDELRFYVVNTKNASLMENQLVTLFIWQECTEICPQSVGLHGGTDGTVHWLIELSTVYPTSNSRLYDRGFGRFNSTWNSSSTWYKLCPLGGATCHGKVQTATFRGLKIVVMFPYIYYASIESSDWITVRVPFSFDFNYSEYSSAKVCGNYLYVAAGSSMVDYSEVFILYFDLRMRLRFYITRLSVARRRIAIVCVGDNHVAFVQGESEQGADYRVEFNDIDVFHVPTNQWTQWKALEGNGLPVAFSSGPLLLVTGSSVSTLFDFRSGNRYGINSSSLPSGEPFLHFWNHASMSFPERGAYINSGLLRIFAWNITWNESKGIYPSLAGLVMNTYDSSPIGDLLAIDWVDPLTNQTNSNDNSPSSLQQSTEELMTIVYTIVGVVVYLVCCVVCPILCYRKGCRWVCRKCTKREKNVKDDASDSQELAKNGEKTRGRAITLPSKDDNDVKYNARIGWYAETRSGSDATALKSSGGSSPRRRSRNSMR